MGIDLLSFWDWVVHDLEGGDAGMLKKPLG